jgi:acyl carrier protein
MSASDDPNLLVSRDQLPLPRPYRAPLTPTERQLAEIWCGILSMDCVGIDDRYQDLGGDSLHATEIFARIQATFSTVLPVSTLMKAPTIAELAILIDQR